MDTKAIRVKWSPTKLRGPSASWPLSMTLEVLMHEVDDVPSTSSTSEFQREPQGRREVDGAVHRVSVSKFLSEVSRNSQIQKCKCFQIESGLQNFHRYAEKFSEPFSLCTFLCTFLSQMHCHAPQVPVGPYQRRHSGN